MTDTTDWKREYSRLVRIVDEFCDVARTHGFTSPKTEEAVMALLKHRGMLQTLPPPAPASPPSP